MTTTSDGEGLRRVTGWLLVLGAVKQPSLSPRRRSPQPR
jgi:hypothetical protein